MMQEERMDISLPIVWLIIAVAMGIVEILTQGLTTIYFTAGALAALIVAMFDTPFWPQVIVFVMVSGISLFLVRPLSLKYLNSKTVKTNIDALIGRRVIAKTEIDNRKKPGKVDLDGSTWMAVSETDDIVISAGKEVEVVRIDGAKVIVRAV